VSELDEFKADAARAALEHVRSGTVVGLGSGSTAAFVITELGRRLRDGELRDVRGVPTSSGTERLAVAAGIPLVALPADGVDVAIDGMDEVDGALDAIKGLGGALTREKIVAAAARTFVLVADHTKRVRRLGERCPVPVEVLEFGLERTASRLAALGCRPVLRRRDDVVYRTDNAHVVLDCAVGEDFEPAVFAAAVERLPGVVGHGLFLGMASVAYLAGADGLSTLRSSRAERP
jgi:ribose 5-phosphate isomerase A